MVKRRNNRQSFPIFSIVVVNYNDKNHLYDCLNSILKNKYHSYEIIVIDNCSSDGSVELVKRKFKHTPFLKIKKLSKNFGPAKARNEGVKIASGKYICFLDNDTQVDENFLVEAKKIFLKNKQIGCLQCKLLLFDDKKSFDYAGEYLGPNGFLIQKAEKNEIDTGQYDQQFEILAAKSAGMFIRKTVFNKINGFDEDYFIYLEETDLGWRSWLNGYRTVFCPKSIVYHHFSSTYKVLGNKQIFNVRFHGSKNYLLTLIKNLESKNLTQFLLRHISIWLLFSAYLLITLRINPAIYIIRGILWNLIHVNSTLEKRRLIQDSRIISDDELFKKVFINKGLVYKIKQYLK